MTLSIAILCHYALFIIMMMNASILSAVMLNAIMLSVMVPNIKLKPIVSEGIVVHK
jgi:hypothetical protein